jgi:thymidine kinase
VAKLYFRYGAMNSGKSTALLQAAFNYEERGHQVVLAKPSIDTRGDAGIMSRLGMTRPADFLIAPDDDVFERFAGIRAELLASTGRDVSCLLVDEAQFLTEEQVDDLLRISILEGVPVLAYGIRTDFQTIAFPGSRRLLEIAHSLEELKTICRCGRKAMFNARKVDGRFVFDGDQVAIDQGAIDLGEVTYEPLCGVDYLAESGGLLGSGRRRVLVDPPENAYVSAPDDDFE